MKIVATAALLAALAVPAAAEIWQWTDSAGTVNFTEDYSSIPKKFRKKAVRLGYEGTDTGGSAQEETAAAPAKGERKAPAGKPAVQPGEKPAAPADASPAEAKEKKQVQPKSESYGGKSAAQWQGEFEAINNEINEVKRTLAEKRNKVFGDASGISREEYFALQKDVTALEKKYADVYKRKQALIKAADAAGVPDDLRW